MLIPTASASRSNPSWQAGGSQASTAQPGNTSTRKAARMGGTDGIILPDLDKIKGNYFNSGEN
jgi:hypothetical protein